MEGDGMSEKAFNYGFEKLDVWKNQESLINTIMI